MSTVVSQMQKEFVLKLDHTGVSRKNNRDFRVVELHDPIALESTCFFAVYS